MRRAGARPARPHERFLRRRRAVRSQRWRWPLLGLALLALVAAAGWAVFVSPLLAVRQVDVTGAATSEVARLSVEKVRAQVDVSADTPLARVDLEGIVGAVEELPSVASATAARDWPSSVTVTVVERRPVAAIEAHGAWRALDAGGVIFGAYRRLPGGLPQVSASQAEPSERDAALAEAAAVVTALEPAIAARVSSVEASSRDDVVLRLASGEQVRWGSAEDSAVKARVLTVLLRVPAAAYDVSVPELPTTSQTALEPASSTSSR